MSMSTNVQHYFSQVCWNTPVISPPKKKLGIAAHPKGPATPEMKAPRGYKSQVWWLVHTCILNK